MIKFKKRNMNIQATFSKEFKAIVERRALELIEKGQDHGVLNDSFYGELSIYIDNKPLHVLYSGSIGEHHVYVGGEEE